MNTLKTRSEVIEALQANAKGEGPPVESTNIHPGEWTDLRYHADEGPQYLSSYEGWVFDPIDVDKFDYRLKKVKPLEVKPPHGFAFCDEPWAPDQHDSAIAWHPKHGYGYHNCFCGGTPPWRWIRPAGVPIAELLDEVIDELSNPEGISAWSYRQSLHRLLATYKNVTTAPGVPLAELRELARDMCMADDADMCRKWLRELIAKHEGRK